MIKPLQIKYKELFNHIPDLVFLLSLTGEILEINESACEALGYRKDELCGKNIASLIGKDFLKYAPERFRQIKKSGSHHFITEHQKKNGGVVPVEVSAKIICIGDKNYILAVNRNIAEREKVFDQLTHSEEKHRAVVETLGDGFWMLDMQGRLLDVNDVYVRQSGYTRKELLSMRIPDLEASESPGETKEHVQKVIAEGHDRFESLHRRKNGEIWPVEVVTNYWDIDEGIIFGFIIDISKRKEVEKEIELMARVFQNANEAMVITDAHNKIIKTNKSFEKLTGYNNEEVVGEDPKILSAGRMTYSFYRDMWETLSREGKWSGEIWDKRKDGSEYPKWLSISVVKNKNNEIINYLANFQDITERKRAEREITELAYHDSLTGTHNRLSLINHLEQSLLSSDRNGLSFSIIFLDLDRFKTINDSLGHHVGDALLIQATERMNNILQKGDILGRLGGDEFVIILTGCTREQVKMFAKKLVAEISRSFYIDDHVVYTSPSIGVAFYPEDGTESNTLMQKADMAMYNAKLEGGKTYRFFNEDMNALITDYLSIEHYLHKAIENDEFILYFQPMVDTLGDIIAVEALIRWNHPELGLLTPARFIHVAEESNLILDVSRWVIETACQKISDWKNTPAENLIISINASAKEFMEDDYARSVIELLKEFQVPTSKLEIEITESLAMKNPEKVMKHIATLEKAGIKTGIDDFGTGYSSLAYLSRFPVSKLKIDRSFISNIEKDKTMKTVTLATIDLAARLNKTVVAEGIENENQRNMLKEFGCDLQQGYYYSRPVPQDVLFSIIQNPPWKKQV